MKDTVSGIQRVSSSGSLYGSQMYVRGERSDKLTEIWCSICRNEHDENSPITRRVSDDGDCSPPGWGKGTFTKTPHPSGVALSDFGLWPRLRNICGDPVHHRINTGCAVCRLVCEQEPAPVAMGRADYVTSHVDLQFSSRCDPTLRNAGPTADSGARCHRQRRTIDVWAQSASYRGTVCRLGAFPHRDVCSEEHRNRRAGRMATRWPELGHAVSGE